MSDKAEQGRDEADNRSSEGAADGTGGEREAERGDVAEPDAPTAAEENEGLSTILDAGPLLGVQDDASDV